MRKVGILVIIGLLAITGVMAAMAYNEAVVTNDATMIVENTSESLLALQLRDTEEGNQDGAAWIGEDGRLYFDFSKGYQYYERNQWGFQPGSTYTWDALFTVKNKSTERIVTTIDVEDMPYISISYVHGGACLSDEIPLVVNGVHQNNALAMQTKTSANVKISFTIPAEGADLEEIFGKIIVKSRTDNDANLYHAIAW